MGLRARAKLGCLGRRLRCIGRRLLCLIGRLFRIPTRRLGLLELLGQASRHLPLTLERPLQQQPLAPRLCNLLRAERPMRAEVA
jgi:hypothetical protein